MPILGLDHLVLTVADPEAACRFYGRVLGLERVEFGGGRLALGFGAQKINLHQAGASVAPHAADPRPGSADLCFEAAPPLAALHAHVRACGVDILLGPVPRTGARGPMRSFYFRDPDGNLVEVCCYGEG